MEIVLQCLAGVAALKHDANRFVATRILGGDSVDVDKIDAAKHATPPTGGAVPFCATAHGFPPPPRPPDLKSVRPVKYEAMSLL